MNLPHNPYARSFLIGAFWLAIVIIVSLSRHPGTWADYPRQQIFILVLISAIAAGQLGVIATHFEKMRSWSRIFIGTMLAWFLVVGLMLLTGKLHSPPQTSGLTVHTSTDSMMAHFAGEAIKWVKQDRAITLDYSPDSIKIIEEELDRIHKTKQPKPGQPGLTGTAMGYGAYVGEVIRRGHGGTWGADHPAGGSNSYPLKITKPDTTIFPIGWCFKRLVNGEEDNVYVKYTLLTATDTNQIILPTNSVPAAP